MDQANVSPIKSLHIGQALAVLLLVGPLACAKAEPLQPFSHEELNTWSHAGQLMKAEEVWRAQRSAE